MATWEFFASKLDGTLLGPINNASQRSVSVLFQRPGTCTFKIKRDNARYADLIGGDALIKAYRTGRDGQRRVAFNGMLLSLEETRTAGEEGIVINAVSHAWRLTKRYVGPAHMVATNDPDGDDYAGTLSAIAQKVLEDVNGTTAGSTAPGPAASGVRLGTVQATPTSYTISGIIAKPAAEFIAEMAAAASSYEYDYAMIETEIGALPWTSGPRVATAKLDIYYPAMGAQKPGAIFEFGTDKANVRSYTRTVSNEGLLNRAWGLPPTGSSAIQISEDSTSYQARGLFEEIINSDLDTTAARQKLMDENVLIRKIPRVIVNFEPVSERAPEFFSDFYLGDSVRFRVVRNGSIELDVFQRVYGATFNLDEAGTETTTFELTPP